MTERFRTFGQAMRVATAYARYLKVRHSVRREDSLWTVRANA